jgi:hypothetical protein
MEWIKDFLTYFDEIELFIVKTTGLISIFLFCLFYILRHIKDFGRDNSLKKTRRKVSLIKRNKFK